VHTRPSGSTTLIGTLRRRAAAIPLGLLAVAALVIPVFSSATASAAPQPTVAQVQQKLNQLNKKADLIDEQFDQVTQELATANQRLTLVNNQVARYLARFQSMRAQVAEIAAAAFEDGSLSSPAVLLTSANPQEILNQSSILQELSSSNDNEMKQFLSAAHQLTATQQADRRTKAAIAALKANVVQAKNSVDKLKSQTETLLAQLTPAQQTTVDGGAASGGSTGTIGGNDPLPTNSQAGKAVAFVYAQLGCPYVFGGTGPCQQGFDCSGLVQSAWASAGVSIPRTSEEQWAQLPHVPISDLQPGDILVFNGAGHVGMFVGDGMMIDAPHTGLDVEKVPYSGAGSLDGAVRP
jgi:peptidoglycan DL-endopeptidase CwlO